MPYTFTSRLRVLVAAIVALAVIAMPAAATAKPKHKQNDRNNDGISDKWAKKNKLGKGKGVAKKDPDSDGLNNLIEFRADTNPRKPDSDGDGVVDAGEDGDGDKVDNGNEMREKTHPGKADSDKDGTKDGSEDADRDRLNNAGEDESGNDPINPDSDDDGIEDGDEGAGRIDSFDGTTLTIKMFGGATLAGTVDEATSVWCDDSDLWGEDEDWGDDESGKQSVASTGDEYGDGEDPFGDDSSDDESGDDEFYDDEGDDGDYVDEGECAIADLTAGTVVRGASLTVDEEGSFFDEVEIVK
jgi:hypothetical protein